MTTDTCIECEVNLAKYKCLERDYDRMNMEAQRDRDMMEATLQNDNTNPDVDFNAIRRDLCILPKCNDPKCLTRHGNYSVLLKLYEEHIVQRKKHFKMADISIKQNQIMGSSQMLQRHSNRKDLEAAKRGEHNAHLQYTNLLGEFEALRQIKTDPLCRDTEILKLRQEVEDTKKFAMERNTTCVNANLQYTRMEQLKEEASKENTELRMKLDYCNRDIKNLQETVDAFRQAQPQDLQSHTCGMCTDLKCAQKINQSGDKLYGAQRELAEKDAKLQQLSDICEKLRRENAYLKEQNIQALNAESGSVDNKRKYEDTTQTVITRPTDLEAKFTQDLSMKFNCLFFVGTCTSVIDENTLYDSFLMDQPENERLEVLSQVYASCHNGQDMQERDKKKFKSDLLGDQKDSSRVNKRSFAACLKTMGGISRRRNNKIVWVNIHLRRQPCFQKRQLG